MKVTFISPYYSNIWENIGIGYIISYCKKNYDGDVEFVSMHDNFDRFSDIINSALESDIVAFSCTSPTYSRGISIAKLIKLINPGVHIVFGGWHVTATKTIESPVDQIIVGEGERAFLEVMKGNRTPIISNLDVLSFSELPWPDRVAIRNGRHLDWCEKTYGERIASFQSRRGCPMSCTFCSERLMSNNNVRIRDPEDTLDEIEYVSKKYRIDRFKFIDPTHGYPKLAAISFCKEKIRRNNRLPWEAMSHAAFITKDILKLMKESGCMQINIGIETADPYILKDIKKGVTIKKIEKVFKWCDEVGLDTRGFFMIGFPNETGKSYKLTKEFIKKIKPKVVGFTILAPYPGNSYYSEEYKDVDWSKVDEYSNDIWSTKNYTNSELKDTQENFATEFANKLPLHQREVMEERNG